MKHQSKILFALSVICCTSFSSFGQLIVDNSLSDQQLAQLIVGNGVTITNVTTICPPNAYGSFDGTGSNIGLPQGLILTSGSIDRALGPNDRDSASINNHMGGDPHLQTLIPGYSVYDACILFL